MVEVALAPASRRWRKSRIVKTINVVSIGVSIGIIGAVAVYGENQTTAVGHWPQSEAVVDATGNLHVPDDYRTAYQFLGSWAVAKDSGQGSKELHVVYASSGTIAAYRKDRRFPDGAVLVKEVFRAATGEMTTGAVSHADTLKGWFVMMKDDKGRFPGNKLWGDGWGWSWFDAADKSKTTSTDYKINCQPCHIPAESSDWVYVGGYPPLRR